MEWTADVSPGQWLHERIDDGEAWGRTMHGVVPHGFEAYARVFHRPAVSSLPGERMPDAETYREMREKERHRILERIVTEDSSWRDTASAFGRTFHPLAQWHALVGVHGDPTGEQWTGWQTTVSPDGREFSAPAEGELDDEAFATLARVGSSFTETPEDAYVAVWAGWGGILGFYGDSPARVRFTLGEAPTDARHEHFTDRLRRDVLNNAFRKPTWQEGTLSRDVSEGPKLELPQREHVLFHAALAELSDADWPARAPWVDRDWGSPQSPSLAWPADHAWVIVTEVDYDSTIVGGSAAFIERLLAEEGLEIARVPEGAVLQYGSDEVNR